MMTSRFTRRRRRGIIAVALLAALAGMLAPPAAVAGQRTAAATPGGLDRAREASRAWIDEVNRDMDAIRGTHPGVLAWSEIVTHEPPLVRVVFKGVPPAGVLSSLTRLPVRYEVRTGEVYSEEERHAATAAVHNAVRALLPSGVDVISGYDVHTGVIETLLDSVTGADGVINGVIDGGVLGGALGGIVSTVRLPALDLLTTTAQQALTTAGLAAVPIHVIPTPNMGARDEANYGRPGGVRLVDPARKACTSAFVVKHRTRPDVGVLTAGHCPNQLTQDGQYAFDFRAEHVGNSGDFQWMRSPYMMDALFHDSHTSVRAVVYEDPSSVSIGQDIGHYGISSNTVYTTVRGTGYCKLGACNLVTTNARASMPGDSGGPWFYGSAVYGIHKGSSTNPATSYFSTLRYALNTLNLKLCVDRGGSPVC